MKKKQLPIWASLALVLLALFFGIHPGGEEAAPTDPIQTLSPETTIAWAAEETLSPDCGEETAVPQVTDSPEVTDAPEETEALLDVHGSYTTKEDVALYIHLYGCLPENFITKNEARKLGWSGGGLDDYAPGMCIGGDRFGNYEGLLPDAPGRSWTECDIDTLGADSRGAKRIVFSNDGLIYYTDDHYESFTLLYGEE